MKKFGILVVMLSFLLTGCVRIPSLQDMAVVQGVGVDYEDGEYQLTLQVFSAEGSGGQTILDPSQQNASTITCRGESLMDALSQTSLSQGRRFFLGHDRLLVLGDGTQALPLSQLLKSLSGSLSLREDVTVVTAENAASLLETEVNQGLLPALTLEQTVENAAANGQVPHVRLLDLNRSLSESWRSCLIPRLQLTDEEEGSLKTVEIVGADLYNGGEYSTFLSESSAAGILMLQNQLDQLALTVELPDFGQVGLELYRFQSSLRPTDTGWKLTASGSASVAEAPAQLEENRLEELTQVLTLQLEALCHQSWAETTLQERDLLFLGDILRRYQPASWKQVENDWPHPLAGSSLELDLQIKIDRFPYE